MDKAVLNKPIDCLIPLLPNLFNTITIPMYQVPAGYPSAAQDYMEEELDIIDFLMGHRRASIFLFRLKGESMRDVGILNNDVIIVDKAIKPLDGHIVVAAYQVTLPVNTTGKTGQVVG